jgi:hypothetical protein
MTRAKRLLWMSAAQSSPFTWSKPDNLSELPPVQRWGYWQGCSGGRRLFMMGAA